MLFQHVSGNRTHCHLEGGQLLGVDDSLVNGVGLREVDHFAERGGDKKHYKAVKDEKLQYSEFISMTNQKISHNSVHIFTALLI